VIRRYTLTGLAKERADPVREAMDEAGTAAAGLGRNELQETGERVGGGLGKVAGRGIYWGGDRGELCAHRAYRCDSGRAERTRPGP